MKKKPVFIWQERELIKLNPDDIVFLAVYKNYTNIYLTGRKNPYMVRTTLSGALKILPDGDFLKIHRAFAVSIYFIEKITNDTVTVSLTELPLSKEFSKPVREALLIIK